MNIEELKLILETITGATESGKTIAVWWLISKTLTPVLTGGLFLVGLIFMVRTVGRLITHGARTTSFVTDLAKHYNVDIYDYDYSFTNRGLCQLRSLLIKEDEDK